MNARCHAGKRYPTVLLRTGVTVGLFVWLFYQIDFHRTTIHWQETEWSYLIVWGPIVFVGCLVINVSRWQLILKLQDLHPSFLNLGIIYAKGSFLSSFLPGGMVTGDMYRMYLLTRNTGDAFVSISSVIFEKLSGVFGLLVLSVGALYFYLRKLDSEEISKDIFHSMMKPGVVLVALIVFGVVALLLIRYLVIKKGRTHPLLTAYASFLDTIPKYLENKRTVAKVLALSLSLQLVIVGWIYIVSKALHLPISFTYFCMTVPMVNLLSMIPISLAGFGVREIGYVFFLVPFGLTPGQATSLALISVLIQNGLHLLLGAVFLYDGGSDAISPAGHSHSGQVDQTGESERRKIVRWGR